MKSRNVEVVLDNMIDGSEYIPLRNELFICYLHGLSYPIDLIRTYYSRSASFW